MCATFSLAARQAKSLAAPVRGPCEQHLEVGLDSILSGRPVGIGREHLVIGHVRRNLAQPDLDAILRGIDAWPRTWCRFAHYRGRSAL
jgi:hypothetical protein